MSVTTFNFKDNVEAGLLICAGGFEDRSLAFSKRLRKTRCFFEHTCILRYESQREDNDEHFQELKSRLKELTSEEANYISVNADEPIQSSFNIKARIEYFAHRTKNRNALIDISGMTHLWAINIIHACHIYGFRTHIVYTEARSYYPPKRECDVIVNAWKNRKYDMAVKYLQSAGLKAVHILPDFVGNFRPDVQTCLIIFVGYEPNRIEGLVDSYAPGALILLYGKSPHERLLWRTKFSKDLHEDLFSKWYIRETDISTLDVSRTLKKLEDEFRIIKDEYDIAIAPQCSKMQGIASYLFWKRHPEVQLIFTSPVRFNPNRYSHGSGQTFCYEIE